jgi:SAM-dependent methyltransferase
MDYEQKLEEQKTQYKSGEEIHDLPKIYHYWSNKYLRPKLEEVFGVSTVCNFYADRFAEQFAFSSEPPRFVSIGSGDGSYEIEITESLHARGLRNFEFICFEVSDGLIAEAAAKIDKKRLGRNLRVRQFDVNREQIDFRVDGFMAHHSLHHVVELERLFAMVDDSLTPHGCFLTMDIIGRNGHMRWPEVLSFIDAIWAVIDDKKKYNNQLKQNPARFLNFDCSREGFEGIRAQDILPLLVARFSFQAFFAVGGIAEVFVDRGYGPNYDPASPADLKFIDFVESLNAQLIELGINKPTMLFADMRKKGSVVSPRLYKNQTPEFCLRDPSH